MDALRKEIDLLDETLLQLIGKRVELMRQIGVYKKQHSLPIRDKQRETEKLTLLLNKRPDTIPDIVIQQIWEVFFINAETIEH